MSTNLLFFVVLWSCCWISRAKGTHVAVAFVVPERGRSCRQWHGCDVRREGSSRRAQSYMKAATGAATETETPTQSKHGNPKARDIMGTLTSRFDSSDGCTMSLPEWSKARNYVYHANGSLSRCQVEEVVTFLDDLFPSSVVKSILQTSPRILRKGVNCSLKPTADFLKELYGPDLFQEAISRNPALLLSTGVGFDGENNELEMFLSDDLELSKPVIKKLKKTQLFQLPTSKVQAAVNYLDEILQSGGFTKSESHRIIGKNLVSHTYLMNLCVDTNLKPRITFLEERCQLEKRDIAVLVKSSPGILGLSVDCNLKPTLNYLAKVVGEPSNSKNNKEEEQEALLRKCILGHPQLLALSMKNLETKVKYFDAIDRLGSRLDKPQMSSLAGRIAIRAPSVYSLSLKENVIPTIEFLANVWNCQSPRVRWDEDELVLVQNELEEEKSDSLAKRLKEYPSVLALSLEGNIQPTFSFFNRTGYIALDEDWRERRDDEDTVSHNIPGRYIAASLYGRLLPRWHHVVSKEWQASQDTVTKLPPLHMLVSATDRVFCKQMGFDLHEYTAFRTENAPRLKFSSQFDTWLKCGRPIDVS